MNGTQQQVPMNLSPRTTQAQEVMTLSLLLAIILFLIVLYRQIR